MSPLPDTEVGESLAADLYIRSSIRKGDTGFSDLTVVKDQSIVVKHVLIDRAGIIFKRKGVGLVRNGSTVLWVKQATFSSQGIIQAFQNALSQAQN